MAQLVVITLWTPSLALHPLHIRQRFAACQLQMWESLLHGKLLKHDIGQHESQEVTQSDSTFKGLQF